MANDLRSEYFLGVKTYAENDMSAVTHSLKGFLTNGASNYALPTINIIREGNNYTIDLTPDPLDVSTISSVDYKQNVFSPELLKTFLHDFTFYPLAFTTDEPLQNHYKRIGAGDNYTPDDISVFYEDKLVVVSEFTTYARPDADKHMNAPYTDKVLKYLPELNKRSNLSIHGSDFRTAFSVLVVSEYCTYSTIMISDSMAADLCFRYRVARAILFKIRSTYGEDFSDIDTSLDKEIYDKLIELGNDFKGKPGGISEYILQESQKPLDARFIKRFYSKLISEVCQEEKSILKTLPAIDEIRNYYKENSELPHGSRKESVINYPSMLPPRGAYEAIPFGSCLVDDTIGRVWENVINKHFNTKQDYELTAAEIASCCKHNTSLTTFKKTVGKKAKKLKVKVKLNPADAHNLACDGIGTNFSNKNLLKNHIENKRRAYNVAKTDTNFIDAFIKNHTWWFEKNETPPECAELIEKLTLSASEVSFNDSDSNHILKSFKQLLGTNLFAYSQFIFDIAQEVLASARTDTSRNEFILKKMSNWKALLLIHTTPVGCNHTFYSVLMPKEGSSLITDIPGIFRSVKDIGSFFVTDFVSIQPDKFENMATTFEQFCMNCAIFSYKLWDPRADSIEKAFTSSAKTMALFSLLLQLEDKSETESTYTLCRYIYMSQFSSFKRRFPQKIISKIPIYPRSKLHVYIIKKLFWLILHVENHPIIPLKVQEDTATIDEDLSTDKFSGLVNFITGEKVNRFMEVLQLFYLGYVVEKNKAVEGNAEFGIIEKMLVVEDKFRKGNFNSIEKRLLDKYPTCGYNSDAVKLAGIAVKDFLLKQYGDGFETSLIEDVTRALRKLTVEDLSTLKATSIYDPNDTSVPTEKEEVYKKSKRNKLIEETFKDLKSGKHSGRLLIDDLEGCLQRLEKNPGGLVCDIFKKAQHGGIREIFVLNKDSRIVQFHVETICKAVCKRIPMETMTHTERKTYINTNHARAVSKLEREKNVQAVTKCLSDDAQKWSQSIHVAKFIIFLAQFLPEQLVRFIARCLNLWIDRKILLPPSLQYTLGKMRDIPFRNETYHLINQVFIGKEKACWLNAAERVLTVRSGMMQGILHYTSSLFHCGVLMLWETMCSLMLQAYKKKKKRNIDLIISSEVSSDDSAARLTLLADHLPKDSPIFLSALCITKEMVSKHCGVITSKAKSLTCSSMMYEFNSEFFVRGDREKPYHKFATACFKVSESETMLGSQEQMSNLRTAFLSEGGTISLTYFINLLQGVMHYRMLGISSCVLAGEFTNLLCKYQDVHIGFFTNDPYSIAGLVPFNFHLWLLCRNSSLGKYQVSLLKQACYEPGAVNYSQIGITTLILSNLQKFKDMIKRMGCTFDWEQFLETNPKYYFLCPDDLPSMMSRIMNKCYSRGVAASIGGEHAFIRRVAASIFMMTCACLSARAVVDDSVINISDTEGKFSLMHKLYHYEKYHADIQNAAQPQNLDKVFSRHSDYNKLLDVHVTLLSAQELSWSYPRCIRSTIQVIEYEKDSMFSLSQMIRHKWFGENLRASQYILSREWKIHTDRHKWLDTSIELSLLNSGFETYRELSSYIEAQERETKVIVLNGPNPGSRSGSILNVCRRFWKSGYILRVAGSHEEQTIRPNLIKHFSSMLTSFPGKELVKQRYMHAYQTPGNWPEMYKLIHSNIKRDISLGVIHGLFANKLTDDDVTSTILMAKNGVYGGYVRRQIYRDNEYIGYGEWCGTIDSVPINIKAYGSEMERIVVRTIDELNQIIDPLSLFCDSSHWRISLGRVEVNQYYIDPSWKVRMSRGGDHGTPIDLDSSINYGYMLDNQTHGYNVRINPNSMQVLGKVSGRMEPIVVMNWTPRATDVLLRADLPPKWFTTPHPYKPFNLLESWILLQDYTAPPKVQAHKVIRGCYDKSHAIMEPTEMSRNFLRVQLQESVRRSGHLGTFYSSYIEQHVIDNKQLDIKSSDLTMKRLEELTDDDDHWESEVIDFDQIFDEENVVEGVGEYGELVMSLEDFAVMLETDLQGSAMATLKSEKITPYTHRLFDQLINDLIRERPMIKHVLKGEVLDSQTSDFIKEFFGMTPKFTGGHVSDLSGAYFD